MREWLTVIIGLLILAVVLDGVRRMRQARRGKLRMPRRMSAAESGDLDGYGSELPNGGARVVKTREPAPQKHEEARIPQQVALNLDEHVPTLMEVEAQEQAREAAEPQHERQKQNSPTKVQRERIEPRLSDDELDEDHPDVILGLVPSRVQNTDSEPDWDFGLDDEDSVEPASTIESGDTAKADQAKPSDKDDFREPEEVLVINVMAGQGQHLYGDVLLETVLDQGMRFGDMNIFHHHQSGQGSGALLYSMANIVVPGTFDLDKMRDFTTPGISLFLALPSDADSSEAFESMLRTAQAIAESQGAELKDENRSVMTAQTIEHYRSRIKEFERKQLSKAPL